MSTEKAGVLSTTSPAPDPPGLQFDGFEISPENVVSDSRVDWSEAKSWLSSYKEEENYSLKLVVRHEKGAGEKDVSADSLSFPQDLYEHAVTNEPVFKALSQGNTGGSAALTSHPWSFYLQTPRDGSPFCSFAIQQAGIFVRGIYLYSDPCYSPTRVFQNYEIIPLYNNWRWDGLHVLNLPVAFLMSHVAATTQTFSEIARRVAGIEATLTQPYKYTDDELNFAAMTQTLHSLESELITLRNRSAFERGVIKSIEDAYYPEKQKLGVYRQVVDMTGLSKSRLDARDPQVATVSKSIENQKTMIFNLSLQRNQYETLRIRQANVEIAKSSEKLAEASMRDAASMRVIAIATLCFLPPTAVATFFSMTMFDWQNSSGVASNYVWVYFVVTVPLTGLVLGIWWRLDRRRRRRPSQPDIEI